ncbi:MAG TPA: glycosyltransferase family 25 protein [Rhizomicrobium sp.]|nr:glycosyltransferase family 25 protein [Rhizomicrobium sp.]
MDLYFINLSRRTDRRQAMEQQAQSLGLSLTRLEAVDAGNADPAELNRRFAANGPLGTIPKGDQCCFLSHRLAWTRLVESGAAYAAVLEDDVHLGAQAPRVLKNADWIPAGIDLIKLEHYGPASQSVLLSDFRDVGHGFRLGRMRSRHTGGAAYVLSRRAAELLLQISRFDLPVDHLLFNPNNSKIFAQLRPWQLLPTVARQQQDATSDIEASRMGLRKFSLAYARRELVRFGYDLKLLPQQVALLASGRAKFVRVAK